jgi:hypothetical protein
LHEKGSIRQKNYLIKYLKRIPYIPWFMRHRNPLQTQNKKPPECPLALPFSFTGFPYRV